MTEHFIEVCKRSSMRVNVDKGKLMMFGGVVVFGGKKLECKYMGFALYEWCGML